MRGEDRYDVGPDGVPTLRRYAAAVWRRKWLFLAPLVVLPALTLVASLRQDPVWEVSADVLVERQETVVTSLIGQTPAVEDAGRTMDTQAVLASVPLVLQRAVDASGVETSPYALLQNSTVLPFANVLRFTVRDADPADAAALAAAYAREFVRYRRVLDTEGLAGTLRDIRRQLAQLEAANGTDSPRYERLADRESQLESLIALRRSSVSVVHAPGAGDPEQVAPRPRRNAAIAFGAGLVVSLVLVFLAESLATRPRSDDEYEALLGAPRLARVALRGPSSRPHSRAGDADTIHALRAGLEHANRDIGARALMVTSPRAEAAGSAAVLELAAAFARAGRNVALVDLDLRESRLSAELGLADAPGLAAVLRGEVHLEDALVATAAETALATAAPERNGRGALSAQLSILPSGADRAPAAEVLSGPSLVSVVHELAARYEIVLAHLPAVLDGPDASIVAPLVDAIVLLVGTGSSHGPALAAARRAVDAWSVPLLGFALLEGDAGGSRATRVGALALSGAREPEQERVA